MGKTLSSGFFEIMYNFNAGKQGNVAVIDAARAVLYVLDKKGVQSLTDLRGLCTDTSHIKEFGSNKYPDHSVVFNDIDKGLFISSFGRNLERRSVDHHIDKPLLMYLDLRIHIDYLDGNRHTSIVFKKTDSIPENYRFGAHFASKEIETIELDNTKKELNDLIDFYFK